MERRRNLDFCHRHLAPTCLLEQQKQTRPMYKVLSILPFNYFKILLYILC
jgi:hypothetical protein